MEGALSFCWIIFQTSLRMLVNDTYQKFEGVIYSYQLGLISIPPLLGWKKDEDLTWFYDILSDKGNKTQMDFLQELQESREITLKNFTETLETQVYPQCGVSRFF